MTRITQTKLRRQIREVHQDSCRCSACFKAKRNKLPKPEKVVGYKTAEPKFVQIIDLPHGGKMKVRVSRGQRINIKREFERALKRGDVIFPEKSSKSLVK